MIPDTANAPVAQPLLRIEHLSKDYGAVHALIDANLSVQAGQHVVLIGASGSGKSTLLRCINHLETPTTGTIWLDSETIGGHFGVDGKWIIDSPVELAQKRRHIGMVFQGFHLFAHLNVLDNITIGPKRVLHQKPDAARALAHSLLEKVHMGKHANKFPSQLSGGEQQRVAIARALAMNPKLLLFDEPTSALDPRLTHEVLQVMQELAEEGMTMLVVTHEIRFAQQVADIVVFMENGRIVEMGAANDIFNHAQQPATRTFLSYVM